MVRNIAGNNVRYICPQSLNVPAEDEMVSLYFRVLHPDKNVIIQLKSGDKIIVSRKAQRVNPGEMQHIDFHTADITGDTVTVEVVKED